MDRLPWMIKISSIKLMTHLIELQEAKTMTMRMRIPAIWLSLLAFLEDFGREIFIPDCFVEKRVYNYNEKEGDEAQKY